MQWLVVDDLLELIQCQTERSLACASPVGYLEGRIHPADQLRRATQCTVREPEQFLTYFDAVDIV